MTESPRITFAIGLWISCRRSLAMASGMSAQPGCERGSEWAEPVARALQDRVAKVHTVALQGPVTGTRAGCHSWWRSRRRDEAIMAGMEMSRTSTRCSGSAIRASGQIEQDNAGGFSDRKLWKEHAGKITISARSEVSGRARCFGFRLELPAITRCDSLKGAARPADRFAVSPARALLVPAGDIGRYDDAALHPFPVDGAGTG